MPFIAAPAFSYRNLLLLQRQAREGVMARFWPILNAHGFIGSFHRTLDELIALLGNLPLADEG